VLKTIELIDSAIDDAEKFTNTDDPHLRKIAFDLCRKLFNVNRALLTRRRLDEMLLDFDHEKESELAKAMWKTNKPAT